MPRLFYLIKLFLFFGLGETFGMELKNLSQAVVDEVVVSGRIVIISLIFLINMIDSVTGKGLVKNLSMILQEQSILISTIEINSDILKGGFSLTYKGVNFCLDIVLQPSLPDPVNHLTVPVYGYVHSPSLP